MMSEADWEPQFLERLTYLKSIVKILVVLVVCIMATYDLQCVVNNLVRDVACFLCQFWKTKFLVVDIYG
jgi:hypothetical protein